MDSSSELFDSGIDVIIEDGRLLFSGTPDECKDWLSNMTTGPNVRIWVVKDNDLVPVTINEYLNYPSH